MFPLRDDNPTTLFPYMTLFFISICVVIYLVQYLELYLPQIIVIWGMTPKSLFSGQSLIVGAPDPIVTLFSSMFLHGGWMHLIGNLLFLWIYGNNVEDAMGHIKFIIFYIACGIVAALTQAFVAPYSEIPMIGASGAVSGTLAAYFLLYPKAKVSTLIFLGIFITVVRISAGFLIAIWFITQLFSAYITDINTPGVAWHAHIGGFIAGLVLLPFFKNKEYKLFRGGKKQTKRDNIRIRFRK